MTIAPPGGDDPPKVDLSTLIPHSPPANGRHWQSIGAGIGALIAVLGGTLTVFQTGRADRSADQAQDAVVVTREMAERIRARADHIEREMELTRRHVIELEERVRALEPGRREIP